MSDTASPATSDPASPAEPKKEMHLPEARKVLEDAFRILIVGSKNLAEMVGAKLEQALQVYAKTFANLDKLIKKHPPNSLKKGTWLPRIRTTS